MRTYLSFQNPAGKKARVLGLPLGSTVVLSFAVGAVGTECLYFNNRF